MKKIWRNNFSLVLSTLFILVLYVFTDIFMALIFGGLVDSANNRDSVVFNRYILYSLTLIIIYPIIYWFYNYIKNKMVYKMSTEIKQKLFKSILNYSFNDFYETDVGNKVSLLTNDIKIIETDYLEGVVNIARSAILFISAIVSIFVVSKEMAIFLVIMAIASMSIPSLIGKKIDVYKKRVSDSLKEFTGRITEFFVGYDTIKSFGIEKVINSFFKTETEIVYKDNISYLNYFYRLQSLTILLGSLTFMGGFIFGGFLVSRGIITLGAMIICIQLSNHVTQPIYSMVSNVTSIKSVKKIVDNYDSLLLDSTQETKTIKNQKVRFNHSIKAENIVLEYDGKEVLSNVNFEIMKNKKYAIVGKSGSGKSSLIKIIAGRIKPTSGIVMIDGNEINSDIKENIIDYVSIIDQEVFMFKGSIRDNITLYNESFTDGEILNALNTAGLSKFEPHLNDNEFISEDGKTISGGEKQRISIARALIKETPIILADEVLSGLDNKTAFEIEDQLLKLDGKTIISVTHRIIPTNIARYDEIIVLKDGKIAEIGTYDELNVEGSVFRDIVNYPEDL